MIINQENYRSTAVGAKAKNLLKNVKNEKCPLNDLEYGEKTENHGK